MMDTVGEINRQVSSIKGNKHMELLMALLHGL